MQSQVGSQQPRYQPEYQPQVQARQPAYYPPRQPIGIGGFFSKKIVTIFILIGVLLFFIGAILCNGAAITKVNSDTGDIEGARSLYKAGTIVLDIGALITILALFGGGIASDEIDIKLKISMLSVATAILIVTLIMVLMGAPMGKIT